MIKGVPAGTNYAARLDAFYRPQAQYYDSMHECMLHGRDRLLNALKPTPGSRVVELGAGTGAMLDLWGARLLTLSALELVDICPAMLERAHRRARGHHNIRVVEADATAYRAPWPADCVYFSYSLTMIPDWVRALNNALAMLKPGGKLGIVDFYVTSADQDCARAQHSAFTRWFWTQWFHHDQVHLSENHLSALCTLTDRVHLHEGQGALPYVPLLRAPYYVFVGTKPARPRSELITDLWKKSARQS
ncbi:MAG TPA: methyltransferase domain-containing protein [Burkholderiales bacterium]|nr:methyltransferase domain-containing protein [Burkholderiales bacterium]